MLLFTNIWHSIGLKNRLQNVANAAFFCHSNLHLCMGNYALLLPFWWNSIIALILRFQSWSKVLNQHWKVEIKWKLSTNMHFRCCVHDSTSVGCNICMGNVGLILVTLPVDYSAPFNYNSTNFWLQRLMGYVSEWPKVESSRFFGLAANRIFQKFWSKTCQTVSTGIRFESVLRGWLMLH